jgi:hypothetical protein
VNPEQFRSAFGDVPVPPGMRVVHKPGMADDLMKELAPLLAEDGIDLAGGIVPDMAVLQAAMNRAIERKNMEMSTPVGKARELTVAALRSVVALLVAGDNAEAWATLDRLVVPASADGSKATVAASMGVACGRLDEVLAGRDEAAPSGLAAGARLPAGRYDGKDAASSILVLAAKGRAFRSLDSLTRSAGGWQVQRGTVHSLAAVARAWQASTGEDAEPVVAALTR